MGTEAAANITNKKKATYRIFRKVALALGVIVVLLAGAAGVIWNAYFRLPTVKGVPGGVQDFELPQGPSIAVLPFVNMSGDPEQEYFSDGLTENIIAGLSANRNLFVIARNSTFSYKGKSVKVQNVARELRAQYVVEGSVQKTENRVRITVQLIEANTGHHVWSDRYDRELKDIFALQDEITMKIMRAVGMKLVEGEQYGKKFLPPSGSLEVFKKMMKGRQYAARMNKEDTILGHKELEEAIALDPEFSELYSLLAMTHLLDLYFQASESPGVSFARARKNVKKALSLDNENYYAHVTLSQLYVLRKEHDKAFAALERAIFLNRNGADAYVFLGNLFVLTGDPEGGIKLIEKAMRLNPIPKNWYLMLLGEAYYWSGRYEDSIQVFKQVLQRSPSFLPAHISLTATYSLLGRQEEARHQAEEILKLEPYFSLERFAKTLPIQDNAEVELYIDLLRMAGL